MALIILDRDGVINHCVDGGVKSPNEWEPIDGSLEAIARLNQAGYSVVVVTNQPEIVQGLFETEALTKIHSKMRRMLAQVGGKIESIFYSSAAKLNDDFSNYLEQDNPFFELASRLRIDLTNVTTVGSSLAHVYAAKALGASPVIVQTGSCEIDATNSLIDGVEIYKDLGAVVESLLTGHA